MLTRSSAVLSGLAVVAALALAGCGSDGSDAVATDPAGTAASSPTATGSGTTCSYPPDGQSPAKPVTTPPATPTATGKVGVTIQLNAGTVGATLDADKAPCTVNSFLSLAGQAYFDDTPCHRVTTAASGIYVLQCGDPTATGTGGPGYTFDDELSGHETYPAGTLAMANAGANTNGSQFFIVYADTLLDPAAYTVFGHVDAAGLKVVRSIAAKGTKDGSSSGPPADPVTIARVTVND